VCDNSIDEAVGTANKSEWFNISGISEFVISEDCFACDGDAVVDEIRGVVMDESAASYLTFGCG